MQPLQARVDLEIMIAKGFFSFYKFAKPPKCSLTTQVTFLQKKLLYNVFYEMSN